jgi:hypothetical protein
LESARLPVMGFWSRCRAFKLDASPVGASLKRGKELAMVLLASTLDRAGPLCSEIPDLQVVERGPVGRVVRRGGEGEGPAAGKGVVRRRGDRVGGCEYFM